MEFKTNVVHLIAGGVAGTVGAVLTCPLEVVKTRLQSSTWSSMAARTAALHLLPSPQAAAANLHGNGLVVNFLGFTGRLRWSSSLLVCLRHIVQTEGSRGLFKGLGPTLVGIAPSRAIYFGSYAYSKQVLNEVFTPNSHMVHLCSAAIAGLSAATCTNPVWVVKTRLQLDLRVERKLTCQECVRQIYKQAGFKGFYKGITASYFGVSETVIHLVVYEALKARMNQTTARRREFGDCGGGNDDENSYIMASGGDKNVIITLDYVKFMVIGACSKTLATLMCYPHEVIRTRLREEGTRYNSFLQTFSLVVREEGRAGLYRGLWTQLVRQIPNTAIVMATYETVVHVLIPSD